MVALVNFPPVAAPIPFAVPVITASTGRTSPSIACLESSPAIPMVPEPTPATKGIPVDIAAPANLKHLCVPKHRHLHDAN